MGNPALEETDQKDEQQSAEELQGNAEQFAAEEKKLVRKMDLFLLPTIWIMYLLSYMDRTNIGNARIAGMDTDLSLSSHQYSVILVVFFVTYVVFEVPSNLIMVRLRPSVYLAVIMLIWGGITCCMAAAQNYHHLIIVRILIGVFEAGFSPGILLLLSSWYKKDEQSKRFAVYISAAVLSGAFGGILAGTITSGLDKVCGLAGWRWLFIVEGAATSGFAVISIWILLDFPATTTKFSARERALATARLSGDNIQTRSEHTPRLTSMQALAAALTDWRTWIMVAGYMVIVGSSTLNYFYPTLVRDLGYTAHKAQYMVVPIYAVAFFAVAFTGFFMDCYSKQRGLVIAGWLTVSLISSICVCVVYNFTARYVLLILIASGLWASNGLALSYAASTFGSMPQEVRGVALALVNALGNLAQIYGAYLFPTKDGPKYLMGFGVISGMCFFGICVFMLAHIVVTKYPFKTTHTVNA